MDQSTTLLNFPPLTEGRLIKRYKRFLVDVKLTTGEIVTAHCANTGPMKGVLHPFGRVRLRYAAGPKRKLDWSWEQAETTDPDGSTCWVGVNTSLPNHLVKLAIKAEFLLESLGPIAEVRSEVPYGTEGRSRIDLLLAPSKDNPDQRLIYLEVKNTTWKQGPVGLFPDTITTRGQKHLKELVSLLPNTRAVLVPCISRSDIEAFAPGDSADPIYGELFRNSLKAGVEVYPCCFGFHNDHVTWEGQKLVKTHQV